MGQAGQSGLVAQGGEGELGDGFVEGLVRRLMC